jgi:preprotein translocase subunit SecG
MYYFLITLHIFVAFALILIVLLQAGKGGSLGAIFGGGSQAIFGPRGPTTLLTKLTTIAAVIFMVTSLILTIISSRPHTSSIIPQTQEEKIPPKKPLSPSNPESPKPSTGEDIPPG